jgi:hypothetical protein
MPAVTPTAGKFASSKVVFIVDGYNLLGAKPQSLSYKVTVPTEETTGLGDEWAEHSRSGMRSAELVQGGAFFNTAAGNSHAALKDTQSDPNGANRIAVVGFAGNAIGQPIIGFEGLLQGDYEPLSKVGSLTRANAEWKVSGRADDGVILHALTTETADANTEATSVDNTTAVGNQPIPIVSSVAAGDLINTSAPHGLAAGDTALIAGHVGATPALNGIVTVLAVISPTQFSITTDITVGGTGGTLVRAKTNAGGAGYLEVTDHDLGTFTDALITIRDSADDLTFADKVVFAAETLTRNAQRVTVAGAVNRFTAVSLDRRGAGAGGGITYLAAFARF